MSATSHAMTRPGRGREVIAALLFAAAVLAVAVIGSLAATSSAQTYEALDRPWFAPPTWLFGPAWTALYVLIAVAGWRTWRASGVDVAIGVYTVQLVLNAGWTPLFFAADRFGLAFAEICLLWVSIAVTTVLFARRDRVAGLLLVPYLAWVTYAGALNLAIWQLN